MTTLKLRKRGSQVVPLPKPDELPVLRADSGPRGVLMGLLTFDMTYQFFASCV